MTHEEKTQMRMTIYQHLSILLNKVHNMIETGELTVPQMVDGSKILKNIAKADSALSKACYYETKREAGEDKKY